MLNSAPSLNLPHVPGVSWQAGSLPGPPRDARDAPRTAAPAEATPLGQPERPPKDGGPALKPVVYAAHFGEDGAGAALGVDLVGDDVGDGVDQGQVGEGLGEVAEMAAGVRVHLLRV